jgi:hypothetical protein
MDKVVYVLGAGFSAPLGLPVMSNFLMKSKDMYFSDPNRYSKFQVVFKMIDEMSRAKNYYDANLFNIEEILSIFEMRELLGEEEAARSFIEYIIDVIEHYTPSIRSYEAEIGQGLLPGNWHGWLFGSSNLKPQREYGYFVASLLRLRFQRRMIPISSGGEVQEVTYEHLPDDDVAYSVITLNYDRVLESYAEYIGERYVVQPQVSAASFKRELPSEKADLGGGYLAKLHGSVDVGEIVPPTWNKVLGGGLLASWQLAFKLLAEANHIRIIGYSLPTADAYVKYLLKAAVIDTPHLKSLDVLCLDADGSVKSRYDAFIDFDRYRFVPASILDYLRLNLEKQVDNVQVNEPWLHLNQLEGTHQEFFDTYTYPRR